MSLQGILAATDFSVRSERALQRAALLSRQFSAQLQLLHVVDGDQPAELVALEAAEASALLERNAAALREAAGAAPSVRVSTGATFPSISSEEHPSELQSLMRTSYAVFSLHKHH